MGVVKGEAGDKGASLGFVAWQVLEARGPAWGTRLGTSSGCFREWGHRGRLSLLAPAAREGAPGSCSCLSQGGSVATYWAPTQDNTHLLNSANLIKQ